MRRFLAIDIGASSGRHILGWMEDGRLQLREVYRFKNKMVRENGHLCWNLPYLSREILSGLRRCKELDCPPSFVGIDTWGVDFVLVNGEGLPVGDAVAYRDGRTDGVRERVAEILSPEVQYNRTGIQPQPFNTIYQLCTVREEQKRADRLLFVPEYLNAFLTGEMRSEYTIASTSGLLDCRTRDWDREMMERLGIRSALFGTIEMPGVSLGRFRPEVAQSVGFSAEVILTAAHDTASAVLAVPEAESLYISSGTWSLLGTELAEPITSPESLAAGFTNEGGGYGGYRYLKNIMGLWMIQSIRSELGGAHSFDDLCRMAEDSRFDAVVDVNDDSFLAPKSMSAAVRLYCERHSLPVPRYTGDLLRCVYRSLAESYAGAVEGLCRLTGKRFDRVHIVGGGSRDSYLNRLTAEAVGLPVVTGPTEATAAGNLLVQMIAAGEIADLAEGRRIIRASLDVEGAPTIGRSGHVE
ncbi:MAG: rhamnulokinase [Candidatus Howiella sp.]|jgi:rhamnulokinase